MDPVQKHWMLENWLEDIRDSSELAKNHAYLLASFSHPEQVKKELILINRQMKSLQNQLEWLKR
jgi:hypothetical protein